MPLGIRIGSLGAEKFNFKIHTNTHWKKYFLFPIYYLGRKLDFGSAEVIKVLAKSIVCAWDHFFGRRRAGDLLSVGEF